MYARGEREGIGGQSSLTSSQCCTTLKQNSTHLTTVTRHVPSSMTLPSLVLGFACRPAAEKAAIYLRLAVRKVFLMSSLNPPRRSPRKRSRADSISDNPEILSATASFTTKISKFANDSPSTRRTRSIPTNSAAKIQHDCSADGSVSVVTKTASAAVPRTKSSQTTKKKAIVHALDTPHLAPPRWRETYEAIAEMRRQVLAPVDGMGCANAGDDEKNPKVRKHMFTMSDS